jgi:alcohol dehydrogenase
MRVTACTGIDALSHALETAVTKKRNPMSSMFSREAFKLCVNALPQVLANPMDLPARGRMLLGAALAGMAIENSMLGAAHAAANPLTAEFGLVHGKAVGVVLPAVIRFNGAHGVSRKTYADLASNLPLNGALPDRAQADGTEALAAHIESLLNLAKMPRSLKDCGVTGKSIPKLAEAAARQWTATFNPRPVSQQDFKTIYEEAFSPASHS